MITRWALCLALFLPCAGRVASASVIYSNDFTSTDLSLNPTGVGGGFTVNAYAGGSFASGGGVATGTHPGQSYGTIPTMIQSDSTFSPINTVSTWTILALSPPDGNNTAIVGWVAPGGTSTFTPQFTVNVRQDRVVFDLSDDIYNFHPENRYVSISHGETGLNRTYIWDYSSPLTLILGLFADSWSLDITGRGVSIHQAGAYTGTTPEQVFASAGTSQFSVMAGVQNFSGQDESASFSDVTVVRTPEPMTLISGVAGAAALAARGLRRRARGSRGGA